MAPPQLHGLRGQLRQQLLTSGQVQVAGRQGTLKLLERQLAIGAVIRTKSSNGKSQGVNPVVTFASRTWLLASPEIEPARISVCRWGRRKRSRLSGRLLWRTAGAPLLLARSEATEPSNSSSNAATYSFITKNMTKAEG